MLCTGSTGKSPSPSSLLCSLSSLSRAWFSWQGTCYMLHAPSLIARKVVPPHPRTRLGPILSRESRGGERESACPRLAMSGELQLFPLSLVWNPTRDFGGRARMGLSEEGEERREEKTREKTIYLVVLSQGSTGSHGNFLSCDIP